MTGPHPTLACEAVRLALSPFRSAVLQQHKHAIVLVAPLQDESARVAWTLPDRYVQQHVLLMSYARCFLVREADVVR
jgi:hypothetical protein